MPGRQLNGTGRIADQASSPREVRVGATVQDVYLLMLYEPYESPQHPVPINATIVHALTLLHPACPRRTRS